MDIFTSWLDERLYPGVRRNWDDEILREEVLRHVGSHSIILDLGAGAGIVKEMNFRGLASRVYGIDLDPRVTANPFLDEGTVGSAEAIPYPAETFDVVISDNVLEHLSAPGRVFAEVARVLKPGGAFIVKTPNRWHYVPLIASMTPHLFHQFINRARGRKSEDTMPTHYRANTKGALQTLAASAGLLPQSVRLVERRPEYMRLSAPTYILGWIYERTVNRVAALDRFRVVLVAVMRKPS